MNISALKVPVGRVLQVDGSGAPRPVYQLEFLRRRGEEALQQAPRLPIPATFLAGHGILQSTGWSPSCWAARHNKIRRNWPVHDGHAYRHAVVVGLLITITLSHIRAWKIAIVCLVRIHTWFDTDILQIMELGPYQWRRKTQA